MPRKTFSFHFSFLPGQLQWHCRISTSLYAEGPHKVSSRSTFLLRLRVCKCVVRHCAHEHASVPVAFGFAVLLSLSESLQLPGDAALHPGPIGALNRRNSFSYSLCLRCVLASVVQREITQPVLCKRRTGHALPLESHRNDRPNRRSA